MRRYSVVNGQLLGRTVLFTFLAAATANMACGQGPERPEGPEGVEGVGWQVQDFSLQDFRGQRVALGDYRDQQLVVVAFLGTECPLAKLYTPRLIELSKRYADRSVVVLGVNPNAQDSITELAAYARLHEIPFPVLKDPGNQVADVFGAERTPEVFLLDQQRVVRYRGRIDDQYGVGYIRDEPQQHDLQEAIDQLLAGQTVSVPVTEPTGCIIGRVRVADADSQVTYSNQIARILQQRCVECHRDGEIAPFALTDYEQVSGWAEMIAEVVAARRMPPWHANPQHGDFVNDRSLSDEEKRLIYQWVEAGAPEGDRNLLPEPTSYVTGWQLPELPDLVVEMQERPVTIPAEGAVRYQYYRVDLKLAEDKWLKAVEVQPGNRAVVHHILVFARTPGREREFDGGVGGFLAGYVPGLRAEPYLAGMAKRLPAGSELIFQVHYTPIGSPQQDLSRVGFVFADADQVEYEIRTVSAAQRALRIPPHEDDYQVSARRRQADQDVLLLSMMPHMHLRGKAFSYTSVLPDGTRQVLLDVPAYDFNWQSSYRLSEPLPLPAGSEMHCAATFDNSADNLNNPDPTRTVRWGEQTWDEMMIGYFDIAIPRDAEPASGASARRRAVTQLILQRLDKDANGVLDRSEVPARYREVFERLDRDQSGDVSLQELEDRD